MSITYISAPEAKQLIAQGAILIDIRSGDEYKHEHIVGAINLPIDQLKNDNKHHHGESKVIYYCLGGMRTATNEDTLNQHTPTQAYILKGGIQSWKKEGFEVFSDFNQPAIQRQVQIIAGAIIFITTILGAVASSWFYVIPAILGLGLIFAGITGICGLALLLAKAPWNRQ